MLSKTDLYLVGALGLGIWIAYRKIAGMIPSGDELYRHVEQVMADVRSGIINATGEIGHAVSSGVDFVESAFSADNLNAEPPRNEEEIEAVKLALQFSAPIYYWGNYVDAGKTVEQVAYRAKIDPIYGVFGSVNVLETIARVRNATGIYP